jgi:hypothetical protein
MQRCDGVVCPGARFALFPARLDEPGQALIQVVHVDDWEQAKNYGKLRKAKIRCNVSLAG